MRLSIITLTFNHLDYISDLYCSLRKYCQELDWEWLIGNTGNDNTSEFLRSLDDHRIRCYELPNDSYAENNNTLALCARAPNLLFLNNDTRVSRGFWKQPLTLLNDPAIGIVGSVILNEDGTIQSAGMGLTNATPYSYNLLALPSKRSPQIVPAVTGASLFCNARAFRHLGGFDHAFRGGYYEDTDLCLRMYSSGYMVVVAPQSKVMHKGLGSLDVSRKFWRNIPRNQRLFADRWSLVLRRLSSVKNLPLKPPRKYSALCINPWLSTLGGGEYEFTWATNFLSRYCYSVTVADTTPRINNDLQARFGIGLPVGIQFGKRDASTASIIWDHTYYDLTTNFANKNRLHLKRVMFGPTQQKPTSGPWFLFNSDYTKRSLRPAAQEVVLYPPVDTSNLSKADSLGTRERIILSVGRFATRRRYLNWKNQEALIRFFFNWPLNEKFLLVLAGNVNDDQYFMRCETLVKTAGNRSNILLAPNIPRSDLQKWLVRSMFFVTFTGYESTTAAQAEHFGIALVEAMAAGCVCFAYAKGGHLEIIEHGVSGFLWRTERELSRLLIALSDESQAACRSTVGARARDRAQEFAPKFAELQVRSVIDNWERR
jgi:GT2 family glycosyltransferase